MGLFNRSKESSDVPDYQTYYLGEDIHPRLEAAIQWGNRELFDLISNEAENTFIAGGALRSFFLGEAPRDIDVFTKSRKVADSIEVQLGNRGFGDVSRILVQTQGIHTPAPMNTKKNPNSKLLQRIGMDGRGNGGIAHEVIDLVISHHFDSPEDILANFDFTVACCVLTPTSIVHHSDYFTDLATKRVRFNSLENPLQALGRLQKYLHNGFTIDPEEMWQLSEAIHELPALPDLENKKPEDRKAFLESTFKRY